MIETFSDDIKEISNRVTKRNDYSLEITITDECNLRCTYCFEGDECLKTTTLNCVDDIFDAMDKMLCDSWFMSVFSGIRVGFWGGEPTLRPDILKRFAGKYGDNENVSFHIYTNGVNIYGLMDAFSEHKEKLNVQVSYDGKRINDIKRLNKKGLPSTDLVRKNIYLLHENGFSVSLKSTVTYDVVEYMVDSWDDIKEINDDLGRGIKYCITMDYINDAVMDIPKIKKSFIDIAKKELIFYKDKGYHLFTWFDNEEKVVCGFFKSGMAINTNGGMLYCHGCGYSPSSDDFIFGNISDDDFIDKIKHNYNYFNAPKIKECEDCISVNCVMCNVVKYDNSDKDGFLEKWYDLPCQEKQCDMFREFSKVSISLKDILKEV